MVTYDLIERHAQLEVIMVLIALSTTPFQILDPSLTQYSKPLIIQTAVW